MSVCSNMVSFYDISAPVLPLRHCCSHDKVLQTVNLILADFFLYADKVFLKYNTQKFSFKQNFQ